MQWMLGLGFGKNKSPVNKRLTDCTTVPCGKDSPPCVAESANITRDRCRLHTRHT